MAEWKLYLLDLALELVEFGEARILVIFQSGMLAGCNLFGELESFLGSHMVDPSLPQALVDLFRAQVFVFHSDLVELLVQK